MNEEIKQRWQIDNYVICEMPDTSIVISTVSGIVLGVYNENDDSKLAIAMYLANIEDPTHKFLLRALCSNLLWSHQATIVDVDFLNKVGDEYAAMYGRIREKMDNAGKEAGTLSPESEMTDKQILDEAERDVLFDEMGK